MKQLNRFSNATIYQKISNAIVVAEKLLEPVSPMLNEIREKNDFAFNSGTGKEIFYKICEHAEPLPVFTFRPKWRWTKAVGYFDGKAMHVNTYKLENMTEIEIVANLVHEKMHQIGMSHGSNLKTKSKIEKSVPYFCSEGIINGRWL